MTLRDMIEALVEDIPPGRVMTYGDIAACVGHPGAGRVVGMYAHDGSPEVPWHRVVNAAGGLAAGYEGGRGAQQRALAAEGVDCRNDKVADFRTRRWWPGE